MIGTTGTEMSRYGRRRWRFGALVALVYLVFPAVALIAGDAPLWAKALGAAGLVAFGWLYVDVVPRFIGGGRPQRWLVPAAMFTISWSLLPGVGADFTVVWVFVGVACAAVLSMPQTAAVAVLLAAAMIGMDTLYQQDFSWELPLTLIAVSLWMAGFIKNIRVNSELQNAREELAVLAVAAERQRISRDLHDLLGHSLTAIAIKAGLARRLIDRDPAAAGAEIAEVERLARESLADVRATASGFRDISLAGELAVARSVLTAAGVIPSVPSAVDGVSPAGRDLFGYVVREAVTNVVRHSQATRCTVTLAPDAIEIVDDGSGCPRGAADGPDGHGLVGLAERVNEAGGRLTAGPLPTGGFRVRAELMTA